MRQWWACVFSKHILEHLGIGLNVLFSLFLVFHLVSCHTLPRLNKEYGKEIPTETRSPVLTATPQPTVWSSPTPTVEATEEATPQPTKTPAAKVFTITIVYDNYLYKKGLETDWGFSALVEYGEEKILFDTGASGSILLSNMRKLDIDPKRINKVVLSHIHGDHIGGLQALLNSGARPTVYLLPSFSASYKAELRKTVKVVEVKAGQKLSERVYTTGALPGPPPEQALVLDTTHGLVVITGCAHPGVVTMVETAKRHFHESPYLVLGGFHLFNKSEAYIQGVINEFHRLGVTYAAPCHCSGMKTRAMFAKDYGNKYVEVGVGKVIEIKP
ncbi:MAG: MBL fold metallo-hydrolase [Anaerolineales bacterium]